MIIVNCLHLSLNVRKIAIPVHGHFIFYETDYCKCAFCVIIQVHFKTSGLNLILQCLLCSE